MQEGLNIPWSRYGLIAELAHRMSATRPQFGKTALQKSVYLLKEVYCVDCGYDFELYTYGPFSSQLLQDLDMVAGIGAVNIAPVLSAPGGFHISPGPQNKSLRRKTLDFLESPVVSRALDRLVKDFGQRWAKDLELISTIVYVCRDLGAGDQPVKRKRILKTVSAIKPKFTKEEITTVCTQLEAKHFITFAD